MPPPQTQQTNVTPDKVNGYPPVQVKIMSLEETITSLQGKLSSIRETISDVSKFLLGNTYVEEIKKKSMESKKEL